MRPSNPLIILTGKTASGKDTIMSRLLLKFPRLKRVITTTSRPPRPGETNGVDYNFISEEDFKRRIKQSRFVEYVSYGGNLYGTEKTQLSNSLQTGLIWRIDPSRAGQIRKFISDSFNPTAASDLLERVLVIYLTVPDEVVLERLKKRGFKNGEIEARMREDAKFWQQYKTAYDFIVENVPGQLDQTVDKITGIIENRFP